MKKDLFYIIFTVFSLLALSVKVGALNQYDVFINEVAWMGSENSTSDEWLELYNNTDGLIDVEGWVLKSADGTPEIKLSGTIGTHEFYLLERTNDDTVPQVPADKVYTGALGNSGENLELYDNNGNLVDRADFSSGWTYGNNTTKQTAERFNRESWQTSQNQNGTPRSINSAGATTNEPTIKEPDQTQKSTKEPPTIPATTDNQSSIESHNQDKLNQTKPEPKTTAPAIQSQSYPNGILINEILPSPEGPDQTDEFIEFFNSNNFSVDLSGWEVKDTAGSTSLYVFKKGTAVDGLDYLVLTRPETKISLNNDQDGLILTDPLGNTKNSVSYKEVLPGQSYNRIGDDWQWSLTLTPHKLNVITSDSKTNKILQKPDNSDNTVKAAQAAISDSIQSGDQKNSQNPPWLLFLVILATVIIMAIIFVLVKFKNVRS